MEKDTSPNREVVQSMYEHRSTQVEMLNVILTFCLSMEAFNFTNTHTPPTPPPHTHARTCTRTHARAMNIVIGPTAIYWNIGKLVHIMLLDFMLQTLTIVTDIGKCTENINLSLSYTLAVACMSRNHESEKQAPCTVTLLTTFVCCYSYHSRRYLKSRLLHL